MQELESSVQRLKSSVQRLQPLSKLALSSLDYFYGVCISEVLLVLDLRSFYRCMTSCLVRGLAGT